MQHSLAQQQYFVNGQTAVCWAVAEHFSRSVMRGRVHPKTGGL